MMRKKDGERLFGVQQMNQSEIIEAARLIRPILASQLSLFRATYAPTDPQAPTEHIRQALETFDKLIRAVQKPEDKPNDG